jgi:deoxyguanosine kinase
MVQKKVYIAVEGVIGVGKTTLARLLAERLSARLVLEEAEANPFLAEFYRNRKRFAFQTQLSFLVQRHGQQGLIAQQDIFRRVTVSDYLFDKDRIFASVNLDEKELALYNKIAGALGGELPRPDLVIFLIASTEILQRRIRSRGRSYEKDLDKGYVQTLVAAYNDYFFHYDSAPVLAVDVGETDFREDAEALEAVLKLAQRHEGGTLYYKCSGKA